VEYADSIDQCAADADVLVITTAWDEFRRLDPAGLKTGMPVLIDCWRILDARRFHGVATVVTIGMGPVSPGEQRY
jgi:UDP-N-acetyl-D-mannosaminuronate dehydrogenase